MEMRPPCRGGDDVAAAPFEALAVDRRRARALDHRVNIVVGRAIGRGLHARLEPHHVERNGVERRCAELDLRAERPCRFGWRRVEPLHRIRHREHEGRLLRRRRLVERFVRLVLVERLEKHRLEQLHQRRVEEIKPIGAGAAVVAVAVRRPVRRQQYVARLHRDVDAVDLGVGAGLGVENEPQRIRRVAVRARPFARHDHLVGGDDGAHGAVGIALGRDWRG